MLSNGERNGCFNSLKTKLLSFHHRRSEPNLLTIRMENYCLSVADCLDKLLGLKFTPDVKRNSYIESVAKEIAKKCLDSLHRSKRYLAPPATRVRYDLEWNIAASFGQVLHKDNCFLLMQSRNAFAHWLVVNCLAPYNHFLLLLYRYFHDRSSDELHQEHAWNGYFFLFFSFFASFLELQGFDIKNIYWTANNHNLKGFHSLSQDDRSSVFTFLSVCPHAVRQTFRRRKLKFGM